LYFLSLCFLFSLSSFIVLLFIPSMTIFVLMSYNGRRDASCRTTPDIHFIVFICRLPQHVKPNSVIVRTSELPTVSLPHHYHMHPNYTSPEGAAGCEIHLPQFLCLMCRTRLHSTGHFEELWCLCASLNTSCARYFEVACL
jgi:hypothetical protein